ncbi:ABC-2 type transport system permease protein [Nakamurella flavida]|nr:ABC transporter permease [Nakamurella flavida]MDP9777083.1 ABC-2 type transport system permease protein [Nakamurella flavida]
MRVFAALALAMVKGFFRDRLSLFFSIVFPLFFIIVFGAVFTGGGAARVTVLEVGNVAVVDALPASARTGLDEAVEIRGAASIDDALTAVRRGDAGAAMEQRGQELVLYFSSADPVTAATVQGIFAGFVDQVNIVTSGIPPTYTLTSRQVEDDALQPIQFVAPGMIAYGVAVGATFGAAMMLITWREKRVLRRLRLAPIRTSTVVAARVVVSLTVALVQLAIYVGVSVLPFLGLRLSGAWYMAVPLVLAGTLAFLSIGLLVGAVAKTSEGGAGLVNLITLPMAFLSGAFLPIDTAPGWLTVLSKALPMGYLVEGMKDVMVRGEGPTAALLPIAILLGFAAVLTALATRVFRWDAA